MSSYQLGRVGITLLGLYFLLALLLVAISLVETLARAPDPTDLSIDGVLVFAAIAGLIFTVFGAVPAWILIRNRDPLARRWFSDGDERSLAVSPSQLVEVGLVLLGIYLLVEGVIGAVGTAVALATLRTSTETAEAETDFVIEGGGPEALATILAGALLLRFAKSLSKRWIA